MVLACGSTVESESEETSSGTTTTSSTTSSSTGDDPLCSETTEYCVVCLDDEGDKTCSGVDCEYYPSDDVCYPIA